MHSRHFISSLCFDMFLGWSQNTNLLIARRLLIARMASSLSTKSQMLLCLFLGGQQSASNATIRSSRCQLEWRCKDYFHKRSEATFISEWRSGHFGRQIWRHSIQCISKINDTNSDQIPIVTCARHMQFRSTSGCLSPRRDS